MRGMMGTWGIRVGTRGIKVVMQGIRVGMRRMEAGMLGWLSVKAGMENWGTE